MNRGMPVPTGFLRLFSHHAAMDHGHATALPMAKTLIGSKLVVTGAVANVATANTPNACFWLGDGCANVAIVKKISVSVPNPAGGQKISLYGGFVQNPTTSAMEFHAVTLRIP